MEPNSIKENNSDTINSMKETIAVEIAQHIEKKYGFRWIKCLDLAMSATWWHKDYTIDELAAIGMDELVEESCRQIDNDEIL